MFDLYLYLYLKVAGKTILYLSFSITLVVLLFHIVINERLSMRCVSYRRLVMSADSWRLSAVLSVLHSASMYGKPVNEQELI